MAYKLRLESCNSMDYIPQQSIISRVLPSAPHWARTAKILQQNPFRISIIMMQQGNIVHLESQ